MQSECVMHQHCSAPAPPPPCPAPHPCPGLSSGFDLGSQWDCGAGGWPEAHRLWALQEREPGRLFHPGDLPVRTTVRLPHCTAALRLQPVLAPKHCMLALWATCAAPAPPQNPCHQVGHFGGAAGANLFCVFDGHGVNGKGAAITSREHLPVLLDAELRKYLQVRLGCKG